MDSKLFPLNLSVSRLDFRKFDYITLYVTDEEMEKIAAEMTAYLSDMPCWKDAIDHAIEKVF